MYFGVSRVQPLSALYCILVMATKRRIGVRLATTEAARRQLMQPVACWEKTWVVPENAPSGSTMKVYKWVKTDKKQVGPYVCKLKHRTTHNHGSLQAI